MTPQQFPEPTVGAFIFNPQGQLFLIQSHKWRDTYTIPGGHLELGERLEEALRREVKEETNLDIYAIEFLIFQEFIYDQAFWKKRHFIFFDFSCKTDSMEVLLNDEAHSYVWVSIEKALALPLDKYTRVALQKCIEKQF